MPARLLIAASLALPVAAAAQEPPVHRCTGAGGQTVFTDRRCSDPALGTAVPALPETTTVPPGDCAVSADDLRKRVTRAWQAGNLIDLSGAFLWDGYGAQAAQRRLEALAAGLRGPLQAVELAPAAPGESAWITVRSGPPPATVLAFEARSVHRCWWLIP
ncbi:DUF4124 domain-containing protein [Dokdonella koreensis]|uniref:DUF4124 domain-containing protein n=1 Tax=Dokdonella koreensis DS-123 TaxID=1300342 RepID=A0A160DRX6_9GAMM|nr:DUF4124 domain-containing protein [Dokdonella koreensis]ANB16975.1 Hypothetical protein I596_945 [Dokdonella koreensis DS-123]